MCNNVTLFYSHGIYIYLSECNTGIGFFLIIWKTLDLSGSNHGCAYYIDDGARIFSLYTIIISHF